MTQSQQDSVEQILNELSDSSASRGWLDCKSGSENVYPRKDLVLIAAAKLQQLMVEAKIEELQMWNVYGHPNFHQTNDLMNRIDTLKAQLTQSATGGRKSDE